MKNTDRLVPRIASLVEAVLEMEGLQTLASEGSAFRLTSDYDVSFVTPTAIYGYRKK